MSWLHAVSSLLSPAFGIEPAPAPADLQPINPKPVAKKASGKSRKPQVKTTLGVQLSGKGKKTAAAAKGEVKVKSGPVTNTVAVKLDERGKLSGKLGQAIEFKLGEHVIRLGGTLDSDGDVKSQVTWNSKLLGASRK